MSKTDKTDKIENTDANLLSNNELDEPTDTSFITNIKIDISASPDKSLPKEKRLLLSDNSTPPKDTSFINNINLGNSRASSRTTTLALDPRPYKKRERAYTTMIVILAVALVAQSVLLWAMHLHHVNTSKQVVEPTNKGVSLERIVISGANLNQKNIEAVADSFMRKYVGKPVIIEPKNERIALAEFAQGQIHIIQMTEPLLTEEKKQLESILGKPIRELYTQTSAIGVCVNNDSLLNELSLDKLRKIYTGEISNAKLVGCQETSIDTYRLEDNQFIDKVFQQKVMKESRAKVSFSKSQEITPINNQERKLFIGYVDIKNLNLFSNKMKLIKIKLSENDKAVAPVIEGKLNINYPLVYKTYWYGANLPENFLGFIIEEMEKQDDLK